MALAKLLVIALKRYKIRICKKELKETAMVSFFQWNSAFFAFSLIIEGTTEKVRKLIMPLKSIYSQNLGFIEQKCIFEHYREFQARKTL